MRIPASLKRYVREFLERHFDLWQRMGVHILPKHFESPVPDTSTLRPWLWSLHSDLPGVDMHEEQQIELLSDFVAAYSSEYGAFPAYPTQTPWQYYRNNGMFEAVDAEMLYCMIRHYRPKRIYEIGSGFSTYVSAEAARRNRAEGHGCELVAFEPNPNPVLKAGFDGLSHLVVHEIQDVPVAEFFRLEENDILFIDSSHVLRIGSDVQYEYLEIVPRLKKGVLIHAHDIHLPAHYYRELILEQHRFFNEQYLVQAFLCCNTAFRVLWASSWFHVKHPQLLESAFPSYVRVKNWPVSFWFRRET